jgi:hypothetical protein
MSKKRKAESEPEERKSNLKPPDGVDPKMWKSVLKYIAIFGTIGILSVGSYHALSNLPSLIDCSLNRATWPGTAITTLTKNQWDKAAQIQCGINAENFQMFGAAVLGIFETGAAYTGIKTLSACFCCSANKRHKPNPQFSFDIENQNPDTKEPEPDRQKYSLWNMLRRKKSPSPPLAKVTPPSLAKVKAPPPPLDKVKPPSPVEVKAPPSPATDKNTIDDIHVQFQSLCAGGEKVSADKLSQASKALAKFIGEAKDDRDRNKLCGIFRDLYDDRYIYYATMVDPSTLQNKNEALLVIKAGGKALIQFGDESTETFNFNKVDGKMNIRQILTKKLESMGKKGMTFRQKSKP